MLFRKSRRVIIIIASSSFQQEKRVLVAFVLPVLALVLFVRRVPRSTTPHRARIKPLLLWSAVKW